MKIPQEGLCVCVSIFYLNIPPSAMEKRHCFFYYKVLLDPGVIHSVNPEGTDIILKGKK